MNLKQRFDALDDNIKLSDAVREEAQEVHSRLGGLVVVAGVAKRTRLQGSFARHTMLGPSCGTSTRSSSWTTNGGET